MTGRRRRERGIVLPLVLIIGLLLSAAIVTFVRRSVVDKMVVNNRDRGAAAAGLARGGIQIATAVLFADRLDKLIAQRDGTPAGSTREDLWARLAESPMTTEWGGQLEVTIEDAGARLNLNALVSATQNVDEGQPSEDAEEFLKDFLDRVLEGSDQPTDQVRDTRELAQNLLDYMDPDDVALNGRNEDDYYLRQDPPYSAANRPLLSVDEVAMVEGFDADLANRLRPYVTVHPLVGDDGINVNTAPPHVLGLIYYGSSGNMRLADSDLVRDILAEREAGRLICTETELAPAECVSVSEVGLGEGSIYPPARWPSQSMVFTVVAEAKVDGVVHSIEAVIDMSDGQKPQLLSWRSL